MKLSELVNQIDGYLSEQEMLSKAERKRLSRERTKLQDAVYRLELEARAEDKYTKQFQKAAKLVRDAIGFGNHDAARKRLEKLEKLVK